jgi:hypothetical protein
MNVTGSNAEYAALRDALLPALSPAGLRVPGAAALVEEAA